MDQNPYLSPDDVPDVVQSSKKFSIFRVTVALVIIAPLVLLFLAPATRRGREPARRTQCKSNLKQIGLALASYHDDYGSFPPAYTVDADGNRLHSWRTLLLPKLDQKALYDKIDLSKPWNDPVNIEYSKINLSCFRCPSSWQEPGSTQYVAVVSPRSLFSPDRAATYRDITDGSSNTLAIVEVNPSMAVSWMSPDDPAESEFLSFDSKTKFWHTGGFHALLADGTVRFITANTSKETLIGIITPAGGETLGDF